MSSNFPISSFLSETQRPRPEIDWDAYASQYDLLAMYNPSYSENIELMRGLLAKYLNGPPASILDVGAGTGNYLCALGTDYPSARLVHLDSDRVMCDIAKNKYETAGFKEVGLVTAPVLEADFGDGTFDLIVCINALYAMPAREETLRKIRKWMSPDGWFFVIDFGRRVDMWDWSKHILGNIVRTKGVMEMVRFLISAGEMIRQHKKGLGQAEGIYWLHSSEEFEGTENWGLKSRTANSLTPIAVHAGHGS
jgi:ubiquinone/menaquinone biosynthesis C-methylase UbiE